jgi:hypothetical protein
MQLAIGKQQRLKHIGLGAIIAGRGRFQESLESRRNSKTDSYVSFGSHAR